MLIHSLLLLASLCPAFGQVEISTDTSVIDNIRFSNLSKRVRDLETVSISDYGGLASTNTCTGANTFTGAVTISSGAVSPWGQTKWVNFVGSGTVTIQGTYGVSSITDGGTGFYTVNFTTPWSSADSYACNCYAVFLTGTDRPIVCSGVYAGGVAQTDSAIEVRTFYAANNTQYDVDRIHVVCVGY